MAEASSFTRGKKGRKLPPGEAMFKEINTWSARTLVGRLHALGVQARLSESREVLMQRLVEVMLAKAREGML